MILLLDTHVLMWFAAGEPRIGRRARRAVDRALRDDELRVSSFTYWEIGMLAAARRLKLRVSADALRTQVASAGVREIPVDGEIAILSTTLGIHGDPADRIIVATALVSGAVLVTADAELLRLRHGPSLLDAED